MEILAHQGIVERENFSLFLWINTAEFWNL